MKRVEFSREGYVRQLIQRKNNGFVKVITGIRRCGKSYLLGTLFRKHLREEGVRRDHILEMSFDLFENAEYRNPKLFYAWVLERLEDDEMHYLLLDEVQLLGDFISVISSLAAKPNCDVYVTGSNARFLSKDIATEFGGRSMELHLSPLTFAEFMSVYSGTPREGWREYMRYGGIPQVVLANSVEEKEQILASLVNETYLRDIVLRNKVRNPEELSALVRFLASSIGCLTNPLKLKNTFASVNQSRITASTLTKYVEYFKDSFLIEEARRYDIKGKAYIGTPMKYYFTDLGLRNARLEFKQQEITHIMENVLYNELCARGYRVDVGNVAVLEHNAHGGYTKKYVEIDFVCRKGSELLYLQSAYTIEDEAKRQQEMRPLLLVKDSNRKIIVTFDDVAAYDTEEGIHVVNLFDYLL